MRTDRTVFFFEEARLEKDKREPRDRILAAAAVDAMARAAGVDKGGFFHMKKLILLAVFLSVAGAAPAFAGGRHHPPPPRHRPPPPPHYRPHRRPPPPPMVIYRPVQPRVVVVPGTVVVAPRPAPIVIHTPHRYRY